MERKNRLVDVFTIYLFMLPYFMPRIFNINATMSKLYFIWEIFSIGCSFLMVLYYVSSRGKRRFSAFVYVVVIYKFLGIGSAFLNNKISTNFLLNSFALISIAILCVYLIKKDKVIFVKCMLFCCEVIIFMNNISFFIIGDNTGYTDAAGNIIYFWNTKNHLASIYMLTLVLADIENGISIKDKDKFSRLFLYANVIFGIIIYRSSTLIIGAVVYVGIWFVIKWFPKLYKPVTFCAVSLAIQILVVFFGVQKYFSWLIEGALNKNLTLSSRTIVWEDAMNLISQKPIIGYGTGGIIPAFWNTRYTIPAHNLIMEIIITSGCVGLIFAVAMFIMTISRIDKNKMFRADKALTCAMVSFSIMMIVESVSPFEPWYVVMSLAVAIESINSEYVNKDLITKRRIQDNKKNWNGSITKWRKT